MRQIHVAVLVGSLRKESFNKKIAQVLKELAPKNLQLDFVSLAELSFFNQDIEFTPPASWETFRAEIRSADAVLFVTPEYNRSVPAVLKNAIDIGSRPYGQSVWDGKPGGVVSVSMGGIGGFGANHHLRQSLVFLNVPIMPQPEAYIGNVGSLFNEDGVLKDEDTRAFLQKYINAYAEWVMLHAKKVA